MGRRGGRGKREGAHLSIEFDGENGVWIAVRAYLIVLLEVAHAELSRVRHLHQGHQAAGEQSLNDAHLTTICRKHQTVELDTLPLSKSVMSFHCSK